MYIVWLALNSEVLQFEKISSGETDPKIWHQLKLVGSLIPLIWHCFFGTDPASGVSGWSPRRPLKAFLTQGCLEGCSLLKLSCWINSWRNAKSIFYWYFGNEKIYLCKARFHTLLVPQIKSLLKKINGGNFKMEKKRIWEPKSEFYMLYSKIIWVNAIKLSTTFDFLSKSLLPKAWVWQVRVVNTSGDQDKATNAFRGQGPTYIHSRYIKKYPNLELYSLIKFLFVISLMHGSEHSLSLNNL